MSIILTIFHYALWAVGIFLLLNCLYLLFFSVMGHRELPALRPLAGTRLRRMCVLIPAYREDVVILDTARQALAHAYSGPATVVVVADGLQPATLATLRQMGAEVVEVTFERSTKGKALLHALTVLPDNTYDVAVVLDADNIMGHGCLTNINAAFDAGYRVVQTHRTAKNQGTAFAFLDACNEEINNHIYRQGPAAIGLSSALIGSGMAFDYSYLRQLLAGIGETVGEDKELDFRIARDGYKIAYLARTYTYDEKIENAQVFTQQRTRWLASQVEFLKKYAGEGIRELVQNGNVEFFHKALQTFLVPRTLLMGVLSLFFLASLVLPVGPSVGFWAVLLGLLAVALFGALPGRLYNKQLVQALVRLPYAIWCMCLALLRIRRTKSSFLATPHRVQAPVNQLENHPHHAV